MRLNKAKVKKARAKRNINEFQIRTKESRDREMFQEEEMDQTGIYKVLKPKRK